MNARNRVPNKSSIYQADPFRDKDGVVGRIVESSLSRELKHSDLVLKYCTISQLMISYYHEKTAHRGKEMTINEIRNVSYWIIICNSDFKTRIAQCIISKHLRGSICPQKMADLP